MADFKIGARRLGKPGPSYCVIMLESSKNFRDMSKGEFEEIPTGCQGQCKYHNE